MRPTLLRAAPPPAALLIVALPLAFLAVGPVTAQEGRVEEARVSSPALANRLGDPLERRVLVYLPPGYDDSAERYPAVYLLHAWGAGPESWLGDDGGYESLSVPAALDSLVGAEAVAPMIVVMPDAVTLLGGSWYAASSTSGDWERFLAEDLVAFVDGRYRTRPVRDGRGVAGQSMGGYGALRLALKRPDVFGAVLSMSPVHTDDPNPLGEPVVRLALEAPLATPGGPLRVAVGATPLPARVLWSKAAAFSPDPGRPPVFARLPWRLEAGALGRDEDAWNRWKEDTLRRLAAAHAGALGELVLRLEVGEDDALADEVRRLAADLTALGLSADTVVFPGGHVEGVRARFEESVFQFFTRAFAPPDDPAMPTAGAERKP